MSSYGLEKWPHCTQSDLNEINYKGTFSAAPMRHRLQQLLCQADFWSVNHVLISFFNPSFLKGLTKYRLSMVFQNGPCKKGTELNEDFPLCEKELPALGRFKQCFL